MESEKGAASAAPASGEFFAVGCEVRFCPEVIEVPYQPRSDERFYCASHAPQAAERATTQPPAPPQRKVSDE